MLTYSEWKDQERKGYVQFVSESFFCARKWHVLVEKMPLNITEQELDDVREGLRIYLKELSQFTTIS
jgi:hypothetical protein